MHYDTGFYSADCKEKVAVDKVVFCSTLSEMKISTPSQTFIIPFDNVNPSNFQTPLFSPTLTVSEANLQQLLSQTLLKTANTSDIYSQTVTFYST